MNATFLRVYDACISINHPFRFKYKQDRIIKADEEAEKARKLKEQENLRRSLLESSQKLHASNSKFIEDITVNWKATQKVKKDRQIRDLQYELSLIRKDELNAISRRNHYTKDETEGITSFEKIMKRNGIGAAEDGSGPPLSISYEDSAVFQDRLSTLAKSQWPTNEEVSDFVTQLKERTQGNRAARYEKVRRRRRAAVGQQQQAADEDNIETDENAKG